MIQMPTKYGLRCFYNQLRRGFKEGSGFNVRYWSLAELKALAQSTIGKPQTEIDCFFGIGWQPSDAEFMPLHFRLAIAISEQLRAVGRVVTPLKVFADSVYISAIKAVPDGTPSQ